MELIKNYMKEDALRHKLNKLTQEVFGFDFEEWVKNNYFQGDYIPYSYLVEEEIVSNVSANLLRFNLMGEEVNLIQIGTVMTKNEFTDFGPLCDSLNQYTEEDRERTIRYIQNNIF